MMFLAQCRSNEVNDLVGVARQNGITSVEAFSAAWFDAAFTRQLYKRVGAR
jgi:hypothetical protein